MIDDVDPDHFSCNVDGFVLQDVDPPAPVPWVGPTFRSCDLAMALGANPKDMRQFIKRELSALRGLDDRIKPDWYQGLATIFLKLKTTSGPGRPADMYLMPITSALYFAGRYGNDRGRIIQIAMASFIARITHLLPQMAASRDMWKQSAEMARRERDAALSSKRALPNTQVETIWVRAYAESIVAGQLPHKAEFIRIPRDFLTAEQQEEADRDWNIACGTGHLNKARIHQQNLDRMRRKRFFDANRVVLSISDGVLL